MHPSADGTAVRACYFADGTAERACYGTCTGTSKLRAERRATVRYRCVCGASFDFDPAQQAGCPHCGRRYAPQVLADTQTFGGECATPLTLPAAADDALIGAVKGHYRIVSRLGQGGMGCVYQAVDESLQRYVALKIIRRPDATGALVEQLVQEARAQARVNHPNVVHIYYVGRADESPFFAMELVPGRTLAQRLENGPLPFAHVMRIALQVASALDRALQYDIVHGDIKPSNLLEVDPPTATVKLSDFGLSRRLSITSDAPEHLVGTPNYLSPESIRGEPIDVRSDIYSLGITLYELTFGRLPYTFETELLQERLDAHLHQAPSFPDPWPAEVPAAWREVLARMMAKEPADRYPDYAALVADLTRLMPRRLILAARLSRGIAWLLDGIALSLLQAICVAPGLVLTNVETSDWAQTWKWPANLLGTVGSGLVLLGAVWVQSSWGVTPGKLFFDLAIVDRHGLPPTKKVLSIRLLSQFPWIAYFFSSLLDVIGLTGLDVTLGGAAAMWVVVNAVMMLGRSDRRALHDWLLGTRVVVKGEV